MTPSISMSFWIETVALAALATLLVFGLVGTLGSWLRSARLRRLLWLVAFATLGLFLLGIGAGADRLGSAREPLMTRSESAFVIRVNMAPERAAPPHAQHETEAITSSPRGTDPSAAPAPVMWPGQVWLGGTLLVLGWGLLQRMVLRFMVRRDGEVASPELRERVNRLARRMGLHTQVRIRLLNGLHGPATFGTGRPTILLPRDFSLAHSPSRQNAMLAHELAHVVARDPFWLGTARVLVALLWWHPAAWWALSRLRAASEAAADEASLLVEDGPTELAACLVALGGRLQRRPIGWLGMAGSGFRSELGRRVERLLELSGASADWRKPRRTLIWIGVVPLFASIVMVSATSWARPHAGDTEPAFVVLAQHALGGRQPADAGAVYPPVPAHNVASQPMPLTLEPVADPAEAPEAVRDTTALVADMPVAAEPGGRSGSTGSIGSSSAPVAMTASAELVTRSFKVNSDLVKPALGQSPSASGGDAAAASLGELFETFGVDWGGARVATTAGQGAGFHTVAGKTLLYNPANGMMLVRAAADDMALIESTLAVLNTRAPQVLIEARFVEITSGDSKALGFDWFLGNMPPTTTIYGGANPSFDWFLGDVHAGGPSSISAAASGADANPPVPAQGVWPGQDALPGLEPSEHDGQFPPQQPSLPGSEPIPPLAATNSTTGKVTGILTGPQLHTLLRALEQRAGVDILSAPRVTTASGRQAQISAVQLKTIVQGLDLQTESDLESKRPGPYAASFRTAQIPVGPTLDVLPRVDADGRSIDLTVIASVTEFLGYESAAEESPLIRVQVDDGKPMLVQAPLPKLRVRTAMGNVRIRDGETVVLGGMTIREQVRVKDKVPVLGDIPLVGRMFRSESQSEVQKNLVVLVTASLVDPEGNLPSANRD
jgi:type II secretory pathway component GspD/PulD (secretin)/beta-lactamase regulating signal transducer with metallopeptidase domain